MKVSSLDFASVLKATYPAMYTKVSFTEFGKLSSKISNSSEYGIIVHVEVANITLMAQFCLHFEKNLVKFKHDSCLMNRKFF